MAARAGTSRFQRYVDPVIPERKREYAWAGVVAGNSNSLGHVCIAEVFVIVDLATGISVAKWHQP
jgi:hypothetical protein